MKVKKLLYYFFLFLFTSGASLILGFLSFGGMLALTPLLTLAVGALILSIAYESEIYFQNIKGAFSKLFFKGDYLKLYLTKKYLLAHFPLCEENCPEFFKDYEKQLFLLNKFHNKLLDKSSARIKKNIEKTFKTMEAWFAERLFATEDKFVTDYEKKLSEWIKAHRKEEWMSLLKKNRVIFGGAEVFSGLAGLFIGYGTIFLSVKTFASITFFTVSTAILPFLVVPMAFIAGIAYALLTYNALTDMINNDTIRKNYDKIASNLSKKLHFRSVFMVTMTCFLLLLAAVLTFCTAGTWWTLIQETPPLFTWMTKIPSVISSVIHPLMTGSSSLIFNIQNTSESLKTLSHLIKLKLDLLKPIKKIFLHLPLQENFWQMINIPRILIKLILTPLRILLFLGHLISIGVTGDEPPWIPSILSALLGIVSEGFEDLHYFFKHEHTKNHSSKQLLKKQLNLGEAHNHEADIPTRLLKLLFSPLYLFTTIWDYAASQLNKESSTRKVLTFEAAWKKHWGKKDNKPLREKVEPSTAFSSQQWQAQQTIHFIEQYKKKHLQTVLWGKDLAEEKSKQLSQLQEQLRQPNININACLEKEIKEPIYAKQRFFSPGKQETESSLFLKKLRSRISPAT